MFDIPPVQRVCLTPLVEKGEAVGETHREAVLCETSALQVLIRHNMSDTWNSDYEKRTHLLEDLLLCSSQVLNVVDGCKDCQDIFLAHCKLKTLILKSSTQWGEDEVKVCQVWLFPTTHLSREHLK